MLTTLKAVEYARLLWVVGFWLMAFWVACQFSRTCRTIRAELEAEGECIDPLKVPVARLDALHAELFGTDDE